MRKKMLENDRYTYRVTWHEEDGKYIDLCAEFPSLSWLASEPEAAFQGIRQVVADAVADLQSSGESIPEPLAADRSLAEQYQLGDIDWALKQSNKKE